MTLQTCSPPVVMETATPISKATCVLVKAKITDLGGLLSAHTYE